jgi:hypothetical protein
MFIDGSVRRETEILLWIPRNPLKSPVSDEGIQGFFSWFFLVFFGSAWIGLEKFGRGGGL